MKKIITTKNNINRKNIKTELNNIDEINIINNLYLNLDINNELYNKKTILNELQQKINSYKQQDIKKNIYNVILLITLDELLEKLVISKLKCYYCRFNIKIIYGNVREPLQWTLDRIDNDKCHSNDNTLISCLKCNLKRRRIDCDKFIFTKQLKLKKIG